MAFKTSPYEKGIVKLFDTTTVRKYPKNQIIFYQGDPLTNICLVQKGYIKAYTILDSGDIRSLFLLGPSDIFPIAFAVDLDWSKYIIRYFYQALSDIELGVVDKQVFKDSVEQNSENMIIYLGYMAATNNAIIDQLETLKTKGAINKVSSLLPYLVKKLGTPLKDNTYKLQLKLSHQEVADLTGLTRETTTQQIKKLESDGLIQQKTGSWIIKLDPDQEESLRN